MKTRLIALFPHFENIDSIQELRLRFDSLAPRIAPHITVLGPFTSVLPRWVLRDHLVKVLEGHPPFKLELQGLSYFGDQYLSLSVRKGQKEIQSLYQAICCEVLAEFVAPAAPAFVPHLVVGRFANSGLREAQCGKVRLDTERFKDKIRQLHLVIIAENSSIEEEFTYQF